MRRKTFGLVLAAALVLQLPLAAQNSECSSYSGVAQAYNVCNAAIDATRTFHPVAGLLVSGGNPVIGTAKTLGGLPHVSLTVRVNAVNVVLPSLTYNGTTTTVPQGSKTVVPAPLVEGALGLWGGLGGGLLAVDALASAQLLPTGVVNNLTVDPNARKIGSIALGLGYGARVGILRGSFPIPSISASVMRRDIPRIQYGEVTLTNNQDYSYAVDLQATNYRLIASTRLLVLDVAAGVGIDKYTGDATIVFRDPITTTPQPPINIALDNTRAMGFFDAGLSLALVKIVGEVGYQGGKDQKLTTSFQGTDTKSGKWFGGAGLRLSF